VSLGSPPSLRFKGDWGAFNLTRICGWLAWEFGRRTGSHHHTIHTGRGMADNLFALGRRAVDVGVSTPAGFARMARQGLGPFAEEPIPELRALGCLPHRDALLVALRGRLGVRTMAELRDVKPSMRVVVAPDDGESFMGLGAAGVLRASGIDPQDILDWGGEFIYGEDPSECLTLFTRRDADAVIQEAIMTPWWNEVAQANDLAFLSLEDAAADRLRDELAIDTVTVEAGYLRGIDRPVQAADFSGWLVAVRDDLPDDVAGTLAAILAETADFFENQYTHIPQRFSPLAYPITPQVLAATPIPLHPAAERYYKSIGITAPGPPGG
jgi:uncharacterized protein